MGKKKGKGKSKKRKSSKGIIKKENNDTSTKVTEDTLLDEKVVDVTETVKVVQKNIKKPISQAFAKILRPNDSDSIADRSEFRKIMKYIKFMFLGLTRTNQTPVVKGASSSSSSSSSNRPSSMSTTDLQGVTTFPCAFEHIVDGEPILVIDIKLDLNYKQLQETIHTFFKEKIDQKTNDEYISEPPSLFFNNKPINNDMEWKQSLKDFHIKRRECQRDVLEQFITETILMLSNTDPDMQIEALHKLREVSTYEELYTYIPITCISTIVNLLNSKYNDVRQGSCELLWSLCFASIIYCYEIVNNTDFINIILSSEFLPYVKAKGTEGALMCRGIGGILAILAMKMNSIENIVLNNKNGTQLCNIIMNGTKVGKENNSPIYAMNILLEMSKGSTPGGDNNNILLIQQLKENRMIDNILKPPPKDYNGIILWKLKIYLLNQFCISTDSINQLFHSNN